MNRLSLHTLDSIPPAVRRPAYHPARPGIGIVHLGIGAFHRAHEAVFTDDVLGSVGGDWGICGVSLRSPGVPGRMAPQDGLFTVVERSGGGDSFRVVGAVSQALFAGGNPAAVVDKMADPATRVVSLTVTEKGYCRDPASGDLELDHPGIRFDLENLGAPRTVLGYLVGALRRRRDGNIPPFSVMCCDNIPHNGRSLKRLCLEFALGVDAGLARWIEDSVSFPSTMVDRIVPAATEADLDLVANALGLRDEAAVVTEPFSQWVIEDDFPTGRPAWEGAGAVMTDDVEPFEAMKLRLLNGPHSAIAYLGFLAGEETVSGCMAWPAMRRYAEELMTGEIAPTVEAPANYDIGAYISELLGRFDNPGLRHRTWQIAMDGSEKLPQRLLGTIRDRLSQGLPIRRLAHAVAAWMRYVAGIDERGRDIDVRDPLADLLRSRARPLLGDAAAMAESLLGLTSIFGADLPANATFLKSVTAALEGIIADGARRTVERLAEGTP